MTKWAQSFSFPSEHIGLPSSCSVFVIVLSLLTHNMSRQLCFFLKTLFIYLQLSQLYSFLCLPSFNLLQFSTQTTWTTCFLCDSCVCVRKLVWIPVGLAWNSSWWRIWSCVTRCRWLVKIPYNKTESCVVWTVQRSDDFESHVVWLRHYEDSGMCLTTYLPFCGNIHANQETKGDISCTPPPPRHQMPASRRVGRAITPAGRKWNIAGKRKGPKLKRILLLGYRLSLLPFSFLTLCCLLWWEEGVNGGHIAAIASPLHNAHLTEKGWGCFPGGHQGCPNINYTFVHLWLTLWWPWLTSEWKRSSKTSPLP